MSTDMGVWLKIVEDAVSWLANEEGQRRAWFGTGPEIDTPDEAFMGFLDDAAVEDFLKHKDTGLYPNQLDLLQDLAEMVRKLCIETNKEGRLPPTFIDDPRWQKVIAAAKKTKGLLDMKVITKK
ncbi:MAG: hypothetical protein JWO78_1957 [Micavibrio sp.]|nr:hypothetical protein [Micavibrio sp.]